jgi:hypothetical protein
MVNWKLKAAIGHDLTPIVCVGETLDKRQSGLTEAVLRWQIACALNGVEPDGAGKLIIAYEPVWAIGTGSTATPSQVQDAHRIIRFEVGERIGHDLAALVRIIYAHGSTRYRRRPRRRRLARPRDLRPHRQVPEARLTHSPHPNSAACRRHKGSRHRVRHLSQ